MQYSNMLNWWFYAYWHCFAESYTSTETGMSYICVIYSLCMKKPQKTWYIYMIKYKVWSCACWVYPCTITSLSRQNVFQCHTYFCVAVWWQGSSFRTDFLSNSTNLKCNSSAAMCKLVLMGSSRKHALFYQQSAEAVSKPFKCWFAKYTPGLWLIFHHDHSL